MSRIGKLPVNLPAGVTVEVAADNTVSVKGPLGTLSQKVDSDIKVEVGTHTDVHTGKEVPAVLVTRPTNQPRHRSLHGLYRALINNMVVGVSKGYEIKQELVGVGNEDGVVGYGLGKASEVQSAIAKGVEDAKKNLVKIPVINGTIPHKQESRYSGSLVMIRPAAPGTGVIAGGAMRAVLESVGIKNVLAKSKGSSNPHNLVKATIGALCELRDAHSIARVRGISMDKVFNG